MLPVMEDPTAKPNTGAKVRLNVSLPEELHKDLGRLSVETGEPFTVLVPRLLRLAAKAEKQRLGLA
jgi:hypothetical protein